MTFANFAMLLAYYSLFLLLLSGENLLLMAAIGCLFTLLIIFIRAGLYHRWIVRRK